MTGRAETVGRPLLYGTTREFLKHFGLNEITDLPRPREIEEILGETQFETERRMLEAQAGADKTKDEEDFKSRLPHIPKKKADLESSSVEIVPRSGKRELRTKLSPELPFGGGPQVSAPDSLEPTATEAPVAGVTEALEAVPAELSTPQSSGETEYAASPEADETSPNHFAAASDASRASSPPSPNRWQSWKEKIQGFIKRLFD